MVEAVIRKSPTDLGDLTARHLKKEKQSQIPLRFVRWYSRISSVDGVFDPLRIASEVAKSTSYPY
jgi:hypothetical protein